MAFKTSDKVKWRGRHHEMLGVVAAVVPPGKPPLAYLKVEEMRNCSVKPLGLIKSQEPRDHESYLVLAQVGDRGINAIYWPAVSLLAQA